MKFTYFIILSFFLTLPILGSEPLVDPEIRELVCCKSSNGDYNYVLDSCRLGDTEMTHADCNRSVCCDRGKVSGPVWTVQSLCSSPSRVVDDNRCREKNRLSCCIKKNGEMSILPASTCSTMVDNRKKTGFIKNEDVSYCLEVVCCKSDTLGDANTALEGYAKILRWMCRTPKTVVPMESCNAPTPTPTPTTTPTSTPTSTPVATPAASR